MNLAPKIALVGAPNCGKTALFNALTGSRQKVANYSGVTIERKEGLFFTKNQLKVRVLDLPGTYSLRARSPDEAITRDVVLGKFSAEPRPNALVCVADATNIHLGLRLVLELKKIGLPIILALNMMDEARERGDSIDLDLLSKELGVSVIPTVATKKEGLPKIIHQVEELLRHIPPDNQSLSYEWTPPSSEDIRFYHKEVERILNAAKRQPGRPTLWSQKIDGVLLHPVGGVLFLLTILFCFFQAVFSFAKAIQDWMQEGFNALQGWISHLLPSGALSSLFSDGIVAGVGSVVVFLPQILTLFFFILVLEDSGYMPRAAFLMDKLMAGVGLHGRSFIPLLSSFACAIPGIMSTRTIENKQDRLITILIAPLMTCSARIPIYTLIIAAFIPATKVLGIFNLQGIVLFILYASGILSGLLVAFILKTFFVRGKKEPLLMELPPYRWPNLRNVIMGLWARTQIFLTRAGTIILALMVIIWFLSSYPTPPAGAPDPAIQYSFAGRIGHWIEPLLRPIGFNWQIAVALIPGMAAREVAVATLGTVYALAGHENSLGGALSGLWSLPTALSFLTWYVFAPQCASTLAVTKRETNSWIWPIVMFLYMLVLAYFASFVVFHLSCFFINKG